MYIKELILSPEEAFDEEHFMRILYQKLQIAMDGDQWVRPVKRSIDARGKKVVVRVQCEITPASEKYPLITYTKDFPTLLPGKQVIIIGSGPAGLFAALRLLESGIKPVILERGADVRLRRRDLAAINRQHIVNPDSNYCFGEGGAGTYSDGKLYTRSTKRGDVKRILEILVAHGAKEEILFDAHPHIGTNKLPRLIENIRETILSAGGEIHFHSRVTDFVIERDQWKGAKNQHGEIFKGDACILATGHSARDIFHLLQDRNILIEAKPFALGVRVEHAQSLIDQIQYHCTGSRNPFLPASSYALVHQSMASGRQRGVFSFCMCPGGFIVPSATAPGEIVVNGMSPSRRDSRFSNSGIVVSVDEHDFSSYRQHGALAGLYLQAEIEQRACAVAGHTQTAPAQRLVDFVERKVSSSLPETSYQPGLASAAMDEVLPAYIADTLRDGFKAFGKKMKGYLTNDAQVVGVESRTSSPVRIPRNRETNEHPQIRGLFPAGEGAGYAGGIVSAAMDGERCAESVMKMIGVNN